MAWGPISIGGSVSGYTLPTATGEILGGVKTGENITNTDGTISLTKNNVTAALGFTPANNSHTHNYAGSGSAGGSANSAVKLDTATAGSATKPVYISGGKPVPCTHSLGKDVPSNAVFTDHTYAKMTAATASAAGKEGLVPAPAAGEQGKFLRGDGTWATPEKTTYSAATQSAAGLMSAADKKRLDNLYPVGSIFQTVSNTSPAALFGGSWEEIASERVLMGASRTHAAGTTVEAGLPNITGDSWLHPNNNKIAENGPFYLIGIKERNPPLAGLYEDLSSSASVGFNAARANPIYGRSSTVQPAAYYVHIWRRVA